MNAQSEIELARTEPNGGRGRRGGCAQRRRRHGRAAGEHRGRACRAAERRTPMSINLDGWDFEESIRHALEGLSDEARSDAADRKRGCAPPSRPGTTCGRTASRRRRRAGPVPCRQRSRCLSLDEALALDADRRGRGAPARRTFRCRIAVPEHDRRVVERTAATVECSRRRSGTRNCTAVAAGRARLGRFARGRRAGARPAQPEPRLARLRGIDPDRSRRKSAARCCSRCGWSARTASASPPSASAAASEQQFALVIMPPGGGLMRVEPVEQSSNPIAMIAKSYAGLVDTLRAAA